MVTTRIAERQSIRLAGYDYGCPGGYFVTVVTRGRVCLFGAVVAGEMRLNEIGRIVMECWEEIPAHFPSVELDEFVIMPNHVHGIVIIHVGATHASPVPIEHASHRPAPGSLGAIVGSFKSAVARRAGLELDLHHIWQRNYYEHILRDNADWERVCHYIRTNPSLWLEDEENPVRISPGGNR